MTDPVNSPGHYAAISALGQDYLRRAKDALVVAANLRQQADKAKAEADRLLVVADALTDEIIALSAQGDK